MTRLYNLVAINDKTSFREVLTAYPMTHAQCCTNKSKFNPAANVRITLELAK